VCIRLFQTDQSVSPEDGDVFSVVERHVGEGDKVSLADSGDLETGFVVRLVPAGERRAGRRRLEMSRHQVAPKKQQQHILIH